MYYGHFSDKYSGRHGKSERETKEARRERLKAEALTKMKHSALVRAVHQEAKAKAKGDLGVFISEIKRFFTRRSS